jgi:DNA-binding NarL/FixJ family response regulator
MKALLIDDHPLILSALQAVIHGLGGSDALVGVPSAAAARQALAAAPDFDLVLLDLQLGDADGFDLLIELRAAYPAIPVVVVSASDHSHDVIRAIDLGAMGFVPKRASQETLQEALQTVMAGRVYVPPMSINLEPPQPVRSQAPLHAPAQKRSPSSGFMAPPRGGVPDAPQPPAKVLASLGLTPRQTEVLGLLLQGQPNKLIARHLNLSVETVKDHVAAVLRSLNVNSRTQAVVAVSRLMQEQNASNSPWHEPPQRR